MISKQKTFLVFIATLFVFSCTDKVQKYAGYTQKELEFLLASYNGKAWERISREEDGTDIILEGCDEENYLIFLEDNISEVGKPKPLLFAYNPQDCDSLDICNLHPEFCKADTALCAGNPEFCEELSEGILFIGSWYAKAPFIEDSRADTLIFDINFKQESIHVLDITANYATFLYKNRTGSSGGSVIENYQYLPPIEE